MRGTIFIIHVKHGKGISEYSQYPGEKEVLLMANTLRVMPAVGTGTKELIACALRCDLSHVAIVELVEVDTKDWLTDFPLAFFPEERVLVALKAIAQSSWGPRQCKWSDNPGQMDTYMPHVAMSLSNVLIRHSGTHTVVRGVDCGPA